MLSSSSLDSCSDLTESWYKGLGPLSFSEKTVRQEHCRHTTTAVSGKPTFVTSELLFVAVPMMFVTIQRLQ